MTNRPAINLRDVARVASSGTIAYLAVHFFLLPQLIRLGVGFPAYFYIGVLATGALSVVLSYAMRHRAPEPQMFPAE